MRIILIVLSMMLLSIPAYAVLPISFWGTVEIDNRSAPAGVVVGVYNETGESILNRTTQIIGDKAYYMLDFNSDETTENVFFKVAGVNASQGLQTIGNKSNINLNLSINTLPNGESCEYDIACSSGNCVEGVCRPPGYTTTTTTTTTVPASRGGGGGGGYSGGGGAWSPTTTIPCPLEYNISMPDKLECYANDIVRIPITITTTRVGCPPADVEVSVDVPSNWTPGHNLVTNLTENETRTVYVTIDVPDVEGNYTLTARSGGIIKEIVLNVKKEMETTTTTSSTTTTVPVTTTTIQSAPTGMAIAIEEYGLYILIIIVLAVIFFVLTRSLKKRKS